MVNYYTAQWFHGLSPEHGCDYRRTGMHERWISSAFHVTGGLPRRDEAAGPSPSHTESSYKLIHSNNKPLSSPAATRSASARNQPANSFRSELWGGGEGRGVCGLGVVIVMLCNWQVCLNPVSDANTAPPTPLLGSNNKRVCFQEREKTCQDDRAIQRLRGYSSG